MKRTTAFPAARAGAPFLAGVLLAALALPSMAVAATLGDSELRLESSTSAPLAKRLDFGLETQLRFAEGANDFERIQLRGMLGWAVAPGAKISLGYQYARHHPGETRAFDEQRLMEQLRYPIASFGAARLSGQNRLEQRWFSGGRRSEHVLRQQLQLGLPLGRGGVRGYIESQMVFVLRGQKNEGTGLDQWRNGFGVELPLGGHGALNVGYTSFYNFPGEDRINNAVTLAFERAF